MRVANCPSQVRARAAREGETSASERDSRLRIESRVES
jgi:hypothetical protein